MPGFDLAAQESLKARLQAEAERLGFDACGVSEATRLDEDARRLEAWLAQGHHATMRWMEGHFEKRVDPRELVPGARSVVSVLHNYYQPVEPDRSPDAGRISRYAWGDDYHDVMKRKLIELLDWLDRETGGCAGRAFVDSAPVLDRAWAARAGLGWVGKSTMLLNRKLGSFFFLGELIVDVPLPADGPIPNYCGSCTRCIDACPTGAIYEPYAVDANRCIAYLTIERREPMPAPVQSDVGNWIFGCDVCQDVCPWTKFSRPTSEPAYGPRPGVPDTSLREWIELDVDEWRRRFRKSPVKRAKFDGFRRNVEVALANAERAAARAPEPED